MNANRFPEASKVLEESFYMDDVVHGCNSIPTGQKLVKDLDILLNTFAAGPKLVFFLYSAAPEEVHRFSPPHRAGAHASGGFKPYIAANVFKTGGFNLRKWATKQSRNLSLPF
ncbi:hypothetical protein ACJJTC_016842 [Scirpophaga incertulas]